MYLRLTLALGAALSLIAFGAPSVRAAEAADPRAKDAVDLYSAFCVGTGGAYDRALAVLGDGNAITNRLPEDVVRQAQGGASGGIGWVTRSPRDAVLMLDYEARGICAVRIAEADEKSVQDAFSTAAANAATAAGARVTAAPEQVRTVEGVKVSYRVYSYPVGDRTAHLALTTAQARIGAQQHFMTFGFVK